MPKSSVSTVGQKVDPRKIIAEVAKINPVMMDFLRHLERHGVIHADDEEALKTPEIGFLRRGGFIKEVRITATSALNMDGEEISEMNLTELNLTELNLTEFKLTRKGKNAIKQVKNI